MPEFLTVRELAALLRIKERKVYELASSGEVPVLRVTGKLLFPEREILAWMASGRSDADGATAPGARPPVFLGSHDPLLEWAIRQSRCGLATRLAGSLDGLDLFAAGEGVACGLHLRDADTQRWNTDAVAGRFARDNAVLVHWARRRRGLVIRPEDAASIRGFADLAGRRVVARPVETGTQALFDRLAAAEALAPQDLTVAEIAPSETDAVQTILQRGADAAFGLEFFARLHGLAFVPVLEEDFDLLIDRRAWFEPQLQRLFAFAASDPFKARLAEMPGYDGAGLGTVRWNA